MDAGSAPGGGPTDGGASSTGGPDGGAADGGSATNPGQPAKRALAVTKTGAGSVQSSPAGIDCGTSCSALFDASASVTLTQSAAPGSHFVGWGGGCSGAGPCTLEMTDDRQVWATFDADAPPPDAECAGIVPAATGQSVDIATGHSSYGACIDGTTSDGQGGVLSGFDDSFENGSDGWQVFSPTGTALNRFFASPVTQPVPYPLDSGFQWFVSGQLCSSGTGACTTYAAIQQISHDGQRTAETTLYQSGGSSTAPAQVLWRSANDPGKGLVVTHVRKPQTTSSPTWALVAQRFDAAGAAMSGETVLAEGSGPGPANSASGIASTGLALVLWDSGGGAYSGAWVDAKGAAVGSTFPAVASVPASAKLELHRLLDGSLVLAIDGAWKWRFASGAGSAEPAPDWLATRPGSTLSIIRGGHAYALFGTAQSCSTEHADLFAPSGKLCGGIDLHLANGCLRHGESGYDGTAILSGYDAQADRCTRSYWPALLQ